MKRGRPDCWAVVEVVVDVLCVVVLPMLGVVLGQPCGAPYLEVLNLGPPIVVTLEELLIDPVVDPPFYKKDIVVPEARPADPCT